MGKRTSEGALDVIDQVKASRYLREDGKHEKGREGGKEGKVGGEESLYVNTYSCWRACQLARWISEILAALRFQAGPGLACCNSWLTIVGTAALYSS